jgi:glycosyltransferase involved in cell wall biosynthesis
MEEALWRESDVVYYPAASETQTVLEILPNSTARTLPLYYFENMNFHPNRDGRKMNEIIFVAGFGHPPNVDAAKWLVSEILPIVRASIPDVCLILAGSNPTDEVKALQGTAIRVTGFVPDEVLDQFYEHAGIAIVPLRFGAGVKGKVLEALHHGLPLVTTSVGAQGLEGLEDVVPVDDDAAGLAKHIVAILQDPDLWLSTATNGQSFIYSKFSQDAVRSVFSLDISP